MRKRTRKSTEPSPEPRKRRLAWAALPLLLAPCWWQPHLVAGDLGSHVYNAWLAELVAKGQAPGLVVARQFTNILFDLILSALLPLGAGLAERLAATLAVCVFLTGAFAFVSEAAGGRPWHALPVLGMLAYGWVFYVGFFNFYLALGLCLWAMALCWNPTASRLAIAAPVLALAMCAHAMPVPWAVGVIGFRWLAPRVGELRLTVIAAAGLVVFRVALGKITPTLWWPAQLLHTLGLDQLWVFDDKYTVAMAGLAVVWALWWLAGRRFGGGAAARNTLLCVSALTAFGIAILPTALAIPGYKHHIGFVADRMSLPLAVSVCAWLAPAQSSKWLWRAGVALALVFFGMLLRDQYLLNGLQEEMARAVAQIPAGQRAISSVTSPDLKTDPAAHMIDRVCVGRCFSYANYEPLTAQFRVRLISESPLIVGTIVDSYRIVNGLYVVQPSDLPLYLVTPSPAGGFTAVPLAAGARPVATPLNPL